MWNNNEMQEFCKNSTYITPALVVYKFLYAVLPFVQKIYAKFCNYNEIWYISVHKSPAQKLKNNIFFVFALKSKLYKAICGHICIKK